MGEVFEAEHVTSGRRVALKVMHHALASEADRKRFLREGRLAAAVNHPNVVYIYSSEEIHESPVIAMELVNSGTLKERIKRSGPLSPAEAVDLALQLIAGLEAAHATGVLHRDIKPGNCFVDSDGTVKVGDFGLSISTVARGESLLTASGSVLGTPAYASPEQLRGEELDVASDLYSVGATLYHMLTGRPPHATTDFVKLITEVLDKLPPAPNALRPDIPAGLAKVIMRCLAKQRTARFSGYQALRDALLPYSSTAPSPAVLGLRFVAGMVDEWIVYGPSLALLVLTGRDAIERVALNRTLLPALVAAAFLIWDLLYYGLPEGLWGASVGKALCRLRLVRTDGRPAGLGRALLRSLIYRTTWSVPLLLTLLLYSGSEYQARMNAEHWNPEDWFWFPVLALLFCTMRRRNGFAGLHDLASGTRVVARPAAQQRPQPAGLQFTSLAPTATPGTSSGSFTRLGPYDVLDSLGAVGSSELLVALDPALRRRVWIIRHPVGTDPVPAARRDLSRGTRLRWLNGQRDATSAWDAYEAPDGTPLLQLPRQSWATVRFWLLDLASEFAAGIQTDWPAPKAELERVWITANNRAMLLEFCAPGAERSSASPPATTNTSNPGAGQPHDFGEAQHFLHRVAEQALGRAKGGTQPPVPLHAQQFLTTLAHRRIETAQILLGYLQSLSGKVAEVSRARRLATLGLTLVPAGLLALAILTGIWFADRRVTRSWPAQYPDGADLRAELRAHEAFSDHPDPNSLLAGAQTNANSNVEDPAKELRRMLKIHMAGRHRTLIEDTNFWTHPVVAEALGPELRHVAEEAVADYSDVNPRKLAQADLTVQHLGPAIRATDGMLPKWFAAAGFWALMFLAALLDFGSIMMVGEPFFLALLGITVVSKEGHKAGRARLLGRSLLTWGACAAGAWVTLLVWVYWVLSTETGALAKAVWYTAGLIVVSAVGILWSTARPTRGWPDWVTRTWLVPR
jgi:uncharacterized RDD family membrane protein YckC